MAKVNYQFKDIERTNGLQPYATLPPNTVRLSKSTLAVSANIVRRLSQHTYQTPMGQHGVILGLAIDEQAQAIKVYARADGFYGRIAKSGTASLAKPKNLQDSTLPQGDYEEVAGTPGIFRFVK